jgi:hypothetical protein
VATAGSISEDRKNNHHQDCDEYGDNRDLDRNQQQAAKCDDLSEHSDYQKYECRNNAERFNKECHMNPDCKESVKNFA